ncbi:MAG: hydantoinase B/oxoprolinase family protein [Acidimicrobiia bacterium]|nr:hydantoinase B/oxoprolinase family protein [Acidimicrobiia bacterium]
MTTPGQGTRAAAALAVWQNRLAGICGEMGAALRRAAYSPNIKEREDFSCAVFDASGELVAQAEHIPVHLGSMPAAVRAALDSAGPLGPGDQVILNDPFSGGTHLNDITFVQAVHDDAGACLGHVANRAHHADVGGVAAGSLSLDAVDTVAEGLCLPPVLAIRRGEWVGDLRRVILANTRTPVERGGDLDAQWGANRTGAGRLAELGRRFGSDAVARAMAAVNDYGERRMRAALGEVGAVTERSFADVLEGVGGETARIEVRVAVSEGRLRADFAGTSPARRGLPCTVATVTRACVEYAARAMTDPDVPRNGGASRCLDLVVPPGSVVAALPPTPVGAGNVETSQRIADVLLGALAPIFPARACAASQGTMNNILIGGLRHAPGTTEGERWDVAGEDPFVYYETLGGGQGGRPGRAGGSGIHTHMTNTKNTPIEALERAFPLRVLRYRLRRGSGGAGWAPGGEGIERDLQVLEDATVSLITERRVSQPWGLAGGGPGAVGENWLLPDGDESRAECLPDKCTIQLKAGDVLRMLTPGGGGWGTRTSPASSM